MFSEPVKSQHIENMDGFFGSVEDLPEINISDINFTEKDIETAISEIKLNAACGDDGFSALLVKNCKKELSVPLNIIWRKSMDTSQIQVYLKRQKYLLFTKVG